MAVRVSPEGVSLLDSGRMRADTRKSMSHVRVSPEGVSLLDSGKIESGYSEEHVSVKATVFGGIGGAAENDTVADLKTGSLLGFRVKRLTKKLNQPQVSSWLPLFPHYTRSSSANNEPCPTHR